MRRLAAESYFAEENRGRRAHSTYASKSRPQPGAMATDSEVDVYEDCAQTEDHYKEIYKILIIGDSNVGKTALLTRFVEGRFQSVFMSTVGECP